MPPLWPLCTSCLFPPWFLPPMLLPPWLLPFCTSLLSPLRLALSHDQHTKPNPTKSNRPNQSKHALVETCKKSVRRSTQHTKRTLYLPHLVAPRTHSILRTSAHQEHTLFCAPRPTKNTLYPLSCAPRLTKSTLYPAHLGSLYLLHLGSPRARSILHTSSQPLLDVHSTFLLLSPSKHMAT